VGDQTEQEGSGSLTRIYDFLNKHDSQIGKIHTDLAGFAISLKSSNDKLGELSGTLARIEASIHKPPEKPNYAAILMFAGMVGALAFSFISPIKEDVVGLEAWRSQHLLDDVAEARLDGRQEQLLTDMEKWDYYHIDKRQHLDDLNHKRDEVVVEIQKEVEKYGTQILAIGNYAKETRAIISGEKTSAPTDRQAGR
jgi:hypothetical protein